MIAPDEIGIFQASFVTEIPSSPTALIRTSSKIFKGRL